MIIERKITVQKSIDEAWNVIGKGFADAYKWATVVSHSQVFGNGKNGASCEYRVCDIKGLGETKENILEYSDKDYRLTFQIEAEKFPKMVKFSSNTWNLKALSKDTTEVSMRIRMDVKGILGKMMSPIMKIQMGGMAAQIAKDFKHYVETGKPSLKKLKAMKSVSL